MKYSKIYEHAFAVKKGYLFEERKGIDTAIEFSGKLKNFYHFALLTDLTVKQYNNEEINKVTLLKRMLKKYDKEVKNLENTLTEKLSAIEKASDIDSFSISVDWTKSRTWGMNPHAELRINAEYLKGTASGCGYDKESSAVARCFNDSLSITKLVYDKLESILESGKTWEELKENVPYGLTIISLPYWEGGVGMSSFINLLKWLGFDCSENHGKTWDCYTFRKIEK